MNETASECFQNCKVPITYIIVWTTIWQYWEQSRTAKYCQTYTLLWRVRQHIKLKNIAILLIHSWWAELQSKWFQYHLLYSRSIILLTDIKVSQKNLTNYLLNLSHDLGTSFRSRGGACDYLWHDFPFIKYDHTLHLKELILYGWKVLSNGLPNLFFMCIGIKMIFLSRNYWIFPRRQL